MANILTVWSPQGKRVGSADGTVSTQSGSICYIGRDLFLIANQNIELARITTRLNGSNSFSVDIVKRIKTNSTFNPYRGVTFDGKNIYATITSNVEHIDINTGTVMRTHNFSGIGDTLYELTFDGKFLYVVRQSGGSNFLTVIEPRSFEEIRNITVNVFNDLVGVQALDNDKFIVLSDSGLAGTFELINKNGGSIKSLNTDVISLPRSQGITTVKKNIYISTGVP